MESGEGERTRREEVENSGSLIDDLEDIDGCVFFFSREKKEEGEGARGW